MSMFVQLPLQAIPKRSGLDCAEKTYSVDCSEIVVSLDFLVTFLSRKLRSNQRGKKTIINNELKVTQAWAAAQKENDFCTKRILKWNTLFGISLLTIWFDEQKLTTSSPKVIND